MMNAKRTLLALALFGMAGAASATTITDGYVGAMPTGGYSGDVVGLSAAYDISRVEANLSGTTLIIDIYTDFAGRAGIKPDEFRDPRLPTELGIGYGDLFLARDWSPYGSAPYADDQYDNGTLWEYGFSIDEPLNNVGGGGTLYQLTGSSNLDNAYLSNDSVYDPNASYRANQEILVKDTSTPVGTGTWSVTPDPDISDGKGDSLYPDTADGMIRFAIDISGTSLLDELLTGDGAIAIHWTMFCANDVIEGEVSIPRVSAPASLLLLGLGLAALGAGQMQRRRRAAVEA